MHPHLRLLINCLLVCTPIALIVSGCGGGSGLVSPTPTISPIPTVTSTPTQGNIQTIKFLLFSGQRVILETQTKGNSINGTIRVSHPGVDVITMRNILIIPDTGLFNVSGTFTAPHGYQLNVTDDSHTVFTLRGQFPTTIQSGTYFLTIQGHTYRGIIPPIGTPFPTPTPMSIPRLKQE